MEFDENLNPIQPEPNKNPNPEPQPQPVTPTPQPAQVPPQPIQTPTPAPQTPTPPPAPRPATPPVYIPPIIKSTGFKGISLVLFAAILAAAILATALIVGNANSDRNRSPINPGQQEGLTVQADAKVYGTPDVARINLGIERKDPNVGTIEQDMSQTIRNIRDRLKELGVKDGDIKTVDLAIDNYNMDIKPMIEPASPAPDGTLTGRHILEVTVRDLTKVDAITKAAIAAGANRVHGIYFTVEDPDKLFQEARSKAIAKAKDKAKQLANDADVRLGRLSSISEWSSSPFMDRSTSIGTGGASTAEIAPGSLEITANVTLVYNIR